MSNLNTSCPTGACPECEQKTFGVCDLGDIFSLEEKRNYQIVIREKFLTVDECGNQQLSCRGTAIPIEDFKRDAIAAVDPGDSTATTILGLRADYNQLLQNLRDVGLVK